ncbi:MAG: hypothetical protein ACREBG_20560 [Pyrinomonadaceae bacterium]
MSLKGKINWKTLVKWVWILVALSTLQLGLGSCFAGSNYCTEAESVFLPPLVLLSFPAGLVALLVVYSLVESGTPEAYSALWLSLFTAGYVQWFIVVAKMNQPQLISLGLSSPIEPSRTISNAIQPMIRSKKPRKRHHRATPAFDRNGRTPLERAIRSSSGLR